MKKVIHNILAGKTIKNLLFLTDKVDKTAQVLIKTFSPLSSKKVTNLVILFSSKVTVCFTDKSSNKICKIASASILGNGSNILSIDGTPLFINSFLNLSIFNLY